MNKRTPQNKLRKISDELQKMMNECINIQLVLNANNGDEKFGDSERKLFASIRSSAVCSYRLMKQYQKSVKNFIDIFNQEEELQ